MTGPPRWISGTRAPASGAPLHYEARIRHRHEPARCSVTPRGDGGLLVRFEHPQWAPAPGQYAVFYDGDECLGGAVIDEAVQCSPGEVLATETATATA